MTTQTLHGSLANLSSHPPPYFPLNPQRIHRLQILKSWLNIAREHGYDLESKIIGRQVLDIGCGQGDMVEAFAAMLKVQGNESSRIIGIDPASLDYGTPTTLGEAQSNISASPVGQRVSFQQSTAPDFVVSQPKGTFSTAYLAHSLYYFPSASTIIQTFKSLLDAGLETLLLAEWALTTSRIAGSPHLLAVLLQSIDPLPEGNVRTVLSPAAYIELARQAGWELVGSQILVPDKTLQDGRWEVRFAREVAEGRRDSMATVLAQNERNQEVIIMESIRAHADALEASISHVGVEEVQCMDVWAAVLRPAQRT